MELKIGDKVIVKEHNVFAKEIENGDKGTIIEKGENIIAILFKDRNIQYIPQICADAVLEKIQDIYDRTYDYDDMKIALCIQDFLDNDNPDMQINFQDFEDIIELAIRIKKSYDKCNKEGTLTKDEQGYIQQFAYNYLKENFGGERL